MSVTVCVCAYQYVCSDVHACMHCMYVHVPTHKMCTLHTACTVQPPGFYVGTSLLGGGGKMVRGKCVCTYERNAAVIGETELGRKE